MDEGWDPLFEFRGKNLAKEQQIEIDLAVEGGTFDGWLELG